jgi:hypothetical protein
MSERGQSSRPNCFFFFDRVPCVLLSGKGLSFENMVLRSMPHAYPFWCSVIFSHMFLLSLPRLCVRVGVFAVCAWCETTQPEISAPGPFILHWLAFGVVAVASSRLGPQISKIKFPMIFGYVLVGIASGPYLLNLVKKDHVYDLHYISQLAVAYIAYSAGTCTCVSGQSENSCKCVPCVRTHE